METSFDREYGENNFTWEKKLHKEKKALQILTSLRNHGNTTYMSSPFNKVILEQATLSHQLIFNSKKTMSLPFFELWSKWPNQRKILFCKEYYQGNCTSINISI